MPEHVNPEQANSELLTAENLTKVFTIRHGFSSTAFSAVDEATFSIDASTPEILTIAGESGSGKTTLARMILGMERVSSGILRYKGRDITHAIASRNH